MGLEEILLIVHIVAMAVWFGGSIMNGVLNMGVEATGSIEANAKLARVGTGLGTKFYMPASILTLLSGIGLVLTSDDRFSFGDPWISFGFLVVIVAAILGPTKFMPISERIADAYDAGDAAAGQAASKEIAMWSAINTGLLFVAIVLMVWKP